MWRKQGSEREESEREGRNKRYEEKSEKEMGDTKEGGG